MRRPGLLLSWKLGKKVGKSAQKGNIGKHFSSGWYLPPFSFTYLFMDGQKDRLKRVALPYFMLKCVKKRE